MTPQEALKKYFGYDDFRLKQGEIIQRTLDGESTMVIMPTGGGKSMCYQLPAILFSGVTIVVSPLIALMQDQVESLVQNGIPAVALNSALPMEAEQGVFNKIKKGEIKLVYVSPEKALNERFLQFIKQVEVSLIAVDEAHCVSIWGNDFRKDYAQLDKFLKQFKGIPKIALTATADKTTQQDIIKQLGLGDVKTYLSSFERTNIITKVWPANDRFKKIIDFINTRENTSGIIYCLSRKSTEELASKLLARGINASHYHAAIPSHLKADIQRDFLNDKIQVICATIAFGMGVDKSNIRWVIHYNVPKNIESYYQEIGRAGRDGTKAEAILFAGLGDLKIQRDFIQKGDASEAFKELQLAKLNRMQSFIYATNCRTNFVLNYFGEFRNEPCNHCDICASPVKSFDGTTIAQKALSACKRTQQTVGVYLLIDILRGANRQEIFASNYHQIKTYGAGKDLSKEDWFHYIMQLVNQGLLEIDFAHRSVLRTTPLSEEVLFSGKEVLLTKQDDTIQLKESPKKAKKIVSADKALLKLLKIKRKEIAQEASVPAYVVFTDKTLEDMAGKKPTELPDLLDVTGIGEHKMDKYGWDFIAVVKEYLSSPSQKKTVKGQTHLVTWDFYKNGLSPEDIAEEREVHVTTIFSHLCTLYQNGEKVNLEQYLNNTDRKLIEQAVKVVGKTDSLKAIHLQLNESLPYHFIRIYLTLYDN